MEQDLREKVHEQAAARAGVKKILRRKCSQVRVVARGEVRGEVRGEARDEARRNHRAEAREQVREEGIKLVEGSKKKKIIGADRRNKP